MQNIAHLYTNKIQSMPIPGIKCKSCSDKGKNVWVIPGQPCPTCGTKAKTASMYNFRKILNLWEK